MFVQMSDTEIEQMIEEEEILEEIRFHARMAKIAAAQLRVARHGEEAIDNVVNTPSRAFGVTITAEWDANVRAEQRAARLEEAQRETAFRGFMRGVMSVVGLNI